MPADSLKSKSRVGLYIRVLLLGTLLGYAIHRPLPEKFTGSSQLDRIAMHIIEPVLRLSYYYPTRLCPNANCMLWWTRGTLNTLSYLIGPIFDYDSQIHMETTNIEGVKVRLYYPRGNASNDGVLLFIHGGGFAIGNTEMYESLTRRMAKMLNIVVLSVDYRLAPETIFPGGLEDCEKVLEYLIQNGRSVYGINPNKIVIMGDSAGGNLAAAVAQRRVERNAMPRLLGQVLVYPLLQFADIQMSSYRYFHHHMHGLALVDPLSVAYYYLWYAGVDVVSHPEYAYAAVSNGHVSEHIRELRDELFNYTVLADHFPDDTKYAYREAEPSPGAQAAIEPFLKNPDFAPLMRKNLTGLPSSMIVTCEFDVLRDEGVLYAKRLKDAGVDTRWVHYEHGFHAMLNFHNELVLSAESLHEILDYARGLIEQASS